MTRFKLTIEYEGTNYAGWQRQADLPSVQQAIEQAIFNFSGEQVTIITAGRTDAGVHARGQVAHVDLQKSWESDKVRDAINAHLQLAGDTVAILTCQAVDEEFNARFSATRRHYLYRMLTRRAPATLESKRVWWLPRHLDAEAMHEGAQYLLGNHDFTTFRSVHCQAKSPIRTLDRLDVTRHGDEIEIYAVARSFLHNQIRSFAGSLAEVGVGRWAPEQLKTALEAKQRSACGPVAPAHGLYLMQVDY